MKVYLASIYWAFSTITTGETQRERGGICFWRAFCPFLSFSSQHYLLLMQNWTSHTHKLSPLSFFLLALPTSLFLLPVGYGDISANTSGEYLVSIFAMLLGVTFYSFTIGKFLIDHGEHWYDITKKKIATTNSREKRNVCGSSVISLSPFAPEPLYIYLYRYIDTRASGIRAKMDALNAFLKDAKVQRQKEGDRRTYTHVKTFLFVLCIFILFFLSASFQSSEESTLLLSLPICG